MLKKFNKYKMIFLRDYVTQVESLILDPTNEELWERVKRLTNMLREEIGYEIDSN